jgi:hypothetical protein
MPEATPTRAGAQEGGLATQALVSDRFRTSVETLGPVCHVATPVETASPVASDTPIHRSAPFDHHRYCARSTLGNAAV